MVTLWRRYADRATARRAVQELRAAGVPADHVHLLVDRRHHDVRSEPVGEFARRALPDDPVGTFANERHARWRPAGGWAGDPDRRRVGTFGDVDGHVIVDYDERGVEHPHVGGPGPLERLLHAAGLDDRAAAHVLDELRAGAAVVLAEVADGRLVHDA